MQTETRPNLTPVKPVDPERHAGLSLICCRCGEWSPAALTWADLNGEPFRAFYCTPCAETIKEG